jgi:hypothetical protein
MIVHSVYNQAIDLLHNSISMLNNILDQTPVHKQAHQTIKDIAKTRDAMKYAIQYISDLEMLVDTTQKLEYENSILKKHNNYLRSQLRPFIEVERMLLAGKLENRISVVKEKLEKENNSIIPNHV